MDMDQGIIIIFLVVFSGFLLYRALVWSTRFYLFQRTMHEAQVEGIRRQRRRNESGVSTISGGQEINTVSRHAELRGQMNELPPDYSKVGGLPPAYDLVVAGNPPAYSEAIQLEINASLAHSHRSTTPATDGAHSTDLTGVVVVPPAVASQQQ
ncbi:uncharacterized protein [Atheta coriaria]|uniref:uncharacterized protein isoform X2 n=1 Tax=Dalotia coriaria TaxID=877792 RepID=UPI0031F3E96C